MCPPNRAEVSHLYTRNENAPIVDSSQRHVSNAFSAATDPFTTCSELDVIISERSIIDS